MIVCEVGTLVLYLSSMLVLKSYFDMSFIATWVRFSVPQSTFTCGSTSATTTTRGTHWSSYRLHYSHLRSQSQQVLFFPVRVQWLIFGFRVLYGRSLLLQLLQFCLLLLPNSSELNFILQIMSNWQQHKQQKQAHPKMDLKVTTTSLSRGDQGPIRNFQ